MTEGDPRKALERLIQERGEDYAGLSRLIGRNPAYVQQYIKRGTPKRLAETDRRLLARYFNVSETLLGAPPPEARMRGLVSVNRLDLGASAGPGALGADETVRGVMAFDAQWLRRLGIADRLKLSLIRVEGDSMSPTLSDGDEILVDGGDAGERLRDGIYVLRVDDALVVKRLSLRPGRFLSVRSDNDAYPAWPDCDLGAVDIVGRVVWTGRRIN